MPSLKLRHACLAAVVWPVCGCGVLDTEAQRSYATDRLWSAPAAFTTADVRIITQRQHPVLHNEVVCTEPSPDVAKALTSSGSLAGSGGNGAATASITASASSAEALAELAGRSTALLALRDTLYRACEAYANGSIGQDAYALILSRYTQLMTTLFLAQDITGAAGAEGKAAAVSNAVQLQGSAPESGSTPPAKPSTTPGKTKLTALLVTPKPWSDFLQPAALTSKPAVPAATDNIAPAQPQSGASATTTTHADLALTRMAEDYMHQSVLGVIVVACIDQNDPTRMSAGAPNPFLARICNQIGFEELEKMARADPPWAPVNPAPSPAASPAAAHTPHAAREGS